MTWLLGQIGAANGKKVTVIGFMDHIRRKFVKAEKALTKKAKSGAPAKCTVARTKMDTQHRIEREMNKLYLTDNQRRDYRQEHAKPKLDELHQWLITSFTKVAKDTLTDKPINYSLNQWVRLFAYCNHGQLHISNVLAENAITPFDIGRKVWMFADTPRCTTASAIYYTLIESAKSNGINPFKYILNLCTHIAKAKTPEDIRALLL